MKTHVPPEDEKGLHEPPRAPLLATRIWKAWTTPRFPAHLSACTDDVKVCFYTGLTECHLHHQVIRPNTVRAHRATGELDTITSSTLDLDALRHLADETLRHYIDMISEVEVFEGELLALPEEGHPGIRRGISRHMLHHATRLEEWGIVERTDQIRAITNLFTVPKKNGALRLVVDARRVNRLMKRVPPMQLPTIPAILQRLYKCRYFATVDGKSFFYQFPLSPEVGSFFCANVSATKGTFVPFRMRRLPMGWNWAPAIAQKTANTLLEDGELGVAWVDNFVFTGNSEGEVNEKFGRFLEKARRVNLQLDTESPEPTQRGEVLGMEVDLAARRHRMSPAWSSKVGAMALTQWMTPREIFQAIGKGVWHGYVTGTPLCHHTSAMELLRSVASLVANGLDWDTPVRVTADQLMDLRRWKERLVKNEWVTLEEIVPTLQVWSDASSEMWAYLATSMEGDYCGPADQGTYPEERWHIFVKEAYAAHLAVHATTGIPRTLRIDNLPLVYAISKKVTTNHLVNEWFRSWDWKNLSVSWVPTADQRADFFTRGGDVKELCKHLREST